MVTRCTSSGEGGVERTWVDLAWWGVSVERLGAAMGASPSRSAKVEDSEAESQSARRARPAAPCEGAGSSAQRSSSASAGAQAAPRQGAVVAPLQQSPSKRRMSGGGFFWRSPTGDVHPADVGVFAEPALLQMHFNAGLPPKVMAGAWRPDPPPPPSKCARLACVRVRSLLPAPRRAAPCARAAIFAPLRVGARAH